MNSSQIIGWFIVAAFYASYYAKMLLQRHKGIKTDQMARGNKPKKTVKIEIFLKTVTYLIAVVQVLSLLFVNKLPIILTVNWIRFLGVGISLLGIIVFVLAMVTMKDSWRAGIDLTQKTAMITNGIYQYSRNPAFVGFDLFYIGFALLFSNILVLISSSMAITLLHLQILEEEKFLSIVYGEAYLEYKKKTCRYVSLF